MSGLGFRTAGLKVFWLVGVDLARGRIVCAFDGVQDPLGGAHGTEQDQDDIQAFSMGADQIVLNFFGVRLRDTTAEYIIAELIGLHRVMRLHGDLMFDLVIKRATSEDWQRVAGWIRSEHVR